MKFEPPADEIRPHYDFDRLRGLGPGAHFDPAARDGTVVRLDADVAAKFPSSEAVNAALRSLASDEVATRSPLTPGHAA